MRKTSRKTGRVFKPETLALSYGFDPFLSEGSIKPPLFLTSTFQFKCANDGRRFFELAYGHRELSPQDKVGLVYSRVNNPNLEIIEDRLAAMEGMDKAALFASGMAAISTTLLTFCEPKDVVVSSSPVYGGTYALFREMLPQFGIETIFHHTDHHLVDRFEATLKELAAKGRRARILFVESPANPTLAVADIQGIAALASRYEAQHPEIIVIVDNTMIGPIYQRPAELGAHVAIYSATKFFGGHSDLVAGVVVSNHRIMKQVLKYRTIFGSLASPFTSWLITRSIETLAIRMKAASENAMKIASYLVRHPKVDRVYYPGLIPEGTAEGDIFRRNCRGPGSLMSFNIAGNRETAYRFLDSLELFRLAVSLGGTESLAQHPRTMTHSDINKEALDQMGVTDQMIRLSVGIENVEDLIDDLNSSLSQA